MKVILAIFFLLSLVTANQLEAQEFLSEVIQRNDSNGETGTLITVDTGQILEIYSWSGGQGVNVQKNGIRSGLPASGGSAWPVRIVGPAEVVAVSPGYSQTYFFTYKKIFNTSLSSSVIPANSVVIPADSAGSVQIILESSIDLITWTQANPGTYGASTTKRFFRIRALNQ